MSRRLLCREEIPFQLARPLSSISFFLPILLFFIKKETSGGRFVFSLIKFDDSAEERQVAQSISLSSTNFQRSGRELEVLLIEGERRQAAHQAAPTAARQAWNGIQSIILHEDWLMDEIEWREQQANKTNQLTNEIKLFNFMELMVCLVGAPADVACSIHLISQSNSFHTQLAASAIRLVNQFNSSINSLGVERELMGIDWWLRHVYVNYILY